MNNMAASATPSCSRRCSARCCASMSTSVPAHCSTVFRSTTLSRSTHRVRPAPAQQVARRFLRWDSATRGAGASTVRMAICGWATSVKARIEEVDRVTLGGNYGWRCFEGTRDTGLACGSPTNLQAPVAEYDNPGLGRAVTGGYVYRGTAFPTLVGRYIFGDFWLTANLEHREHNDADDGHDGRLQFRPEHLVFRRRERRRAVCRRLRRTPVSHHRLKSSGIRFPCAALRSARSACRWSR